MGKTAGQFEIETYTGRFVDTCAPESSTICVEDIAHALAQTCRYGGHSKVFFSVAEHAVFVSRRLERQGAPIRTQIAGLHHDDAEAFLGDIPRPLKPLLGEGYKSLSDAMDRAIVQALVLPAGTVALYHDDAVRLADSWSLFIEAQALLPSRGRKWGITAYNRAELPSRFVTPDYWLGGLGPADAEFGYLSRHTDLMERL
jgi:hypothetical protein